MKRGAYGYNNMVDNHPHRWLMRCEYEWMWITIIKVSTLFCCAWPVDVDEEDAIYHFGASGKSRGSMATAGHTYRGRKRERREPPPVQGIHPPPAVDDTAYCTVDHRHGPRGAIHSFPAAALREVRIISRQDYKLTILLLFAASIHIRIIICAGEHRPCYYMSVAIVTSAVFFTRGRYRYTLL